MAGAPLTGVVQELRSTKALAVDGGAQDLRVGGEALKEDEVRGETKDGEALTSRSGPDVLEQLLPGIGLILERVLRVSRRSTLSAEEFGAAAKLVKTPGGRSSGGYGRWRPRGMLVEGADLLRFALLDDREIRWLKTVNGVSGAIGDDDILDDEVGAGLNCGLGGFRCCGPGLRCWGLCES